MFRAGHLSSLLGVPLSAALVNQTHMHHQSQHTKES
jgi:hypothetical protein